MGYSIDFVDGDMLERSPFTLADFMKQVKIYILIGRRSKFKWINKNLQKNEYLSYFLLQRKRWMQGIYMVVFSNPKIKLKTKMCLMSAMIAWLCLPFCTSTILIQFLFPFNIPLYLDCLQTWLGASATYLYVIGYIRQFPIHR